MGDWEVAVGIGPSRPHPYINKTRSRALRHNVLAVQPATGLDSGVLTFGGKVGESAMPGRHSAAWEDNDLRKYLA